jgi:hypothetical protein
MVVVVRKPPSVIGSRIFLLRANMMGFTVANGTNPDRHNVRLNLWESELDQQAEEVFGRIDGLARQAIDQLTPNPIRGALVPPTDIDGVDGLKEVPLSIGPVQFSGLQLPPGHSDPSNPAIDRTVETIGGLNLPSLSLV